MIARAPQAAHHHFAQISSDLAKSDELDKPSRGTSKRQGRFRRL
jgi:hypothetical protein